MERLIHTNPIPYSTSKQLHRPRLDAYKPTNILSLKPNSSRLINSFSCNLQHHPSISSSFQDSQNHFSHGSAPKPHLHNQLAHTFSHHKKVLPLTSCIICVCLWLVYKCYTFFNLVGLLLLEYAHYELMCGRERERKRERNI